MATDLVIMGAGGFGREASLLVEEINRSDKGKEEWNLLGFLDDDKEKWGQILRGYKVLGGWEVLAELPQSVLTICVVGDPISKKRMVLQAEKLERRFANLIHPDLVLSVDVEVGSGVLINKGCLLTTNIAIGNHVSINPGCGIGHDVVIGAFATLMWRVNLSGAVQVGEGCLIGSGATILQGLTIGEGSIVGAGALLTKDLSGQCTAVGVPARVVNTNK